MDKFSHLALADENALFARNLAASGTEAGWRWSTVVAFYSAHHFVHALLAEHHARLPADRVSGRNDRVSFVHPGAHGLFPGGTRESLFLLAEILESLKPVNHAFRRMLAVSYEARYGLNGRRLTPVTQPMARIAITELRRVESLIRTHLS